MEGSVILLVDDEQEVIEPLSRILEALGHQVLTAGGGQEAFALFRRLHHEIDLVILDLIMPGMNGKETFIRMREIDKHAKVLFTTGKRDISGMEEILQQDSVSIIGKPFDMRALSEKIGEMGVE
jgi:DNA-binding response OmpR family regulator